MADSTLKQYSVTFKLWWNFCERANISPFDGKIRHVLTFLQDLFDHTNNRHGSFSAHRSALAHINSENISTDPLLKRFLKGIFRMRPSLPKYGKIWNPQTVLQFLEGKQFSNLKFLSYKVVTLLALETAQRIQTIFLIKRDNIKKLDSGLKIYITDLVKTSGPTREQPCLWLPYFENKKLCVATLVLKYMSRTEAIKPPGCNSLFLTFRKPFSPASKQTLSCWVKDTLKQAGIDVSLFSAHSTRHASASSALDEACPGIPLEI